ncbi:MAG TPA: SDR family NAD(P)-dependent oxidoreductase, partial [Candidatus Nitrosopolaris sp.]|nr:SDR family NAD(P)-dependent oxidoreductase [Candidatus Nitrosopolaris sp.]
MRFKDRVALITGGGRGIGAATARLLAAEGAKVAVSDLDEVPAREVADPIGGLAIACDVSARTDVEAMVDRTVKELGGLDILVTCAGIIRDNLLYKMTDDDWDSVIDTHLKGTFLCARAAQKHMVEQKSGKIVFLSSTSALGNRGQTNYSAAKAGLQGMARTLAIELGPFNINVNAVAPGFVETRMTRATAERMGVDYEAFKMG